MNKKDSYDIAIHFKPTAEGQRAPFIGVTEWSEYQRLLKEYRRGRLIGTFEIMLDNHPTEITFPLQENDTIHVVLSGEEI